MLDRAAAILTEILRGDVVCQDSKDFEELVLYVIRQIASGATLNASKTFHPNAFPDIRVNGYGIEVKFTSKDKWTSTGNSIFESMRDKDVQDIYLIFGKMGGIPEVRWSRYEESITNVRVANAPRFDVDLSGKQTSLFNQLNVSYNVFSKLDQQEKMKIVREHARKNLRQGGRMWWLDDSHSLPAAIRIYRTLDSDEKKRLRAEVALLCPEVVGPRTRHGKYDNASLYLIAHHGVIAPQVRDLFSAGSVGARSGKRGHKYIIDSLKNIEAEMRQATTYLEMEVIVEYWGFSSSTKQRIKHWLELADGYATDWKPSKELFLRRQ